jgi:osmotically-inducible protein OsmY
VINDIRIKPQAKASDVRAEIHGALERAADLDANTITVEVKGGTVFLGGRVRTWLEREEAERAAWSVPGVIAVEDNIAVTRP